MKQRQLTQEELNLAPEWATHYFIDNTGLCFESGSYYQYIRLGRLQPKLEQVLSGMESYSQPMTRKCVDISEHNFSDDDIARVRVVDGNAYIDDADYEISSVYINKADSIAIAKALGVTASDFIDTKPDNAIIDSNETK